MRVACCTALAAVLLSACEDPKPAMSGRMQGPTDLAMWLGCPQKLPTCDPQSQGHHLLLVVNSLTDDLKIFDVENRSFYEAPNPLFPLNIPVGTYPRAVDLAPGARYAFVVNVMSENVSVVDLSPDLLVEVDTDWDRSTSFCGRWQDQTEVPEHIDERCRAGVSRVPLSMSPLGAGQLLYPEDIVVTPAQPTEDGMLWDPAVPLPVYVSLAGTGQIAVLHFTFPDPGAGTEQRMDLIDVVDVGGRPSGLAMTPDGQTLLAADEASDSIVVMDTSGMTVERIDVGGPSRRLGLAPDANVLYVIKSEDGRVALVDMESRTRRAPGDQPRDTAVNPDGLEMDIGLPGVPRGITFVQGVAFTILDEGSSATSYTTELLTDEELEERQAEEPGFEEHVVETFAYVSDMNGSVYILDAENHRPIDEVPFSGATAETVSLVIDGDQVEHEELLACVDNPDCPTPYLADYDRIYGQDEEAERVFQGVFLRSGSTRTESWTITYQGVLPGTSRSTTGRFEGWELVDDQQPGLDFLAAGARAGDLLEMVLAPTGSDPACEQVDTFFEIAGVEQKRLQLVERQGVAPGTCWNQAVRYQVRAGDGWVVKGSQTGQTERLFMVEPGYDPQVEGYAYDNGRIALTMFRPGTNPDTGSVYEIPMGTYWIFSTNDGFLEASYTPAVQAGVAGPLMPVDLEEGLDEEAGLKHDRVYVLFEASNAMMEFFPASLESSNYLLYQ